MNEMQVFSNPEFGRVRTIEYQGKVLFCGKDVAVALGYTNTRKALGDHCRGVTKRDTPTESGIQTMSFIPEGDVYRLIIRSRLPTAEKFERWVFDEVLPNIRKTGGYGQMDVMAIIQQTAAAMMSEFAKQVLPLFTEPQQQDRAHAVKPSAAFDFFEVTGCKLEGFPLDVRNQVDSMLEVMASEQRLNYSKIARFCTMQGYPITSPSVKTYYTKQFGG